MASRREHARPPGPAGALCSNGPTLIWEYPRITPDGDQVEIVEVMEIAHRLISRHRIYWGWKGSLLILPRLIKH